MSIDVERLQLAIEGCALYWNETARDDTSVEATLDTERYARDIAEEYERLTPAELLDEMGPWGR